jgi:hypothetical protein
MLISCAPKSTSLQNSPSLVHAASAPTCRRRAAVPFPSQVLLHNDGVAVCKKSRQTMGFKEAERHVSPRTATTRGLEGGGGGGVGVGGRGVGGVGAVMGAVMKIIIVVRIDADDFDGVGWADNIGGEKTSDS